jgi:preprotein translocase subunit SecD
MLNHYPWWKWAIIALVIAPGLFYSLPNLFGDDPGIQIRGVRGSIIKSVDFDRVRTLLLAEGLNPKGAVLDEDSLRLRFASPEKQLKARDLLQQKFGNQYTVALTLLPDSPAWLSSTGARPMYLGLDLRGGVHFLMEVDIESVVRRAEERYVTDIRTKLREEKIRYEGVRRTPEGGIEVQLRDIDQGDLALKIIRGQLQGLQVDQIDRHGTAVLVMRLSDSERQELSEFALEQNITALRNRIDELGVAEPVVQRQGNRRIVVQLPGVQDTARAKRILGRTATLETRLVDEEHSLDAAIAGNVPPGSKLYRLRDGREILLKKRVLYSGDNIVDAAASIDSQSGGPIVSISLDAMGARINQRVTGDNVGKRMAVLYIEIRSRVKTDVEGRPILNDDGNAVRIKQRIEEVITAPVIRDQLGKRFQIEGLDSVMEARDLALLLRAGSLAAPVEIIEERTVGPSLGQANINRGFQSVMIGFALVLVFMAFYYRVFGLFANVALALNLILLVAVLSMFQATLTLPGVAGIVLTVGMAVDANVLIFERIREEIRNANSPQASIHSGYEKAFSTIVDANITTLIAAIVLFNFGTGPIKGFAVTLSIGIITSLFTAIFVTRGLVNLVYGGRRLDELKI